ncbi:RNA-binding S4 domain-containing protein [Candidatus Woesearchaeota archaeon]|nr:RNA-binding S4 domain-containing protein [Candidatus Woesearchaeota archaeon]
MANYIELNSFIKLKNLAPTGGMAKLLIKSGKVRVNDETETRNKKKLHAGDKVAVGGETFVVEENILKQS